MPIDLPKAKDDTMRNVRVINIGQSQTPINFMDGLCLLFVGLKLTDHLQDWSWVEVLSPLWGPIMVAWFIKLTVHTFFSHNDEDEE